LKHQAYPKIKHVFPQDNPEETSYAIKKMHQQHLFPNKSRFKVEQPTLFPFMQQKSWKTWDKRGKGILFEGYFSRLSVNF